MVLGDTDGGCVNEIKVELSWGRTLGVFVGDMIASRPPIFSELPSTETFVKLILLVSNSRINADSKSPESIDFISVFLDVSYQASNIALHSI